MSSASIPFIGPFWANSENISPFVKIFLRGCPSPFASNVWPNKKSVVWSYQIIQGLITHSEHFSSIKRRNQSNRPFKNHTPSNRTGQFILSSHVWPQLPPFFCKNKSVIRMAFRTFELRNEPNLRRLSCLHLWCNRIVTSYT